MAGIRTPYNKEYVERLDKDLYLQAFLNNACLRPCCHICSFKTVNRVSDFTMADLWGIKDLCPEWDDNKGVSLLLIHSEKGRQVFKQMSSICKVKKISLRDAIAYNNMAIESLQPHSKREQFIHNVDSMDFDKLVRKYGMPPFSLRRQIANLLRKLGIR